MNLRAGLRARSPSAQFIINLISPTAAAKTGDGKATVVQNKGSATCVLYPSIAKTKEEAEQLLKGITTLFHWKFGPRWTLPSSSSKAEASEFGKAREALPPSKAVALLRQMPL